MNTVVLGAAALISVALVLGALTWREGYGWLPAFLLAIPAAIWLPGFFFAPWQRTDLLWAQLAGWPWILIALAAVWTLRHRVQWYAWDSRNFFASLVLGWLAAALVARGGLDVVRKLPELLASSATDGLDPWLYRLLTLAMVPVMAWSLWMIGVALGRVFGLLPIALLRRVRGLGFYSSRLKFRHRPGEETVEWHYHSRKAPKGWQRRDVSLRHLSMFTHESRTEQVYERNIQTFEARGRFSGEQITGTIEGPGQWVNRTRFTGKSHLTLGDLSMEVPTPQAASANRTLELLFKRYVGALHRADKERQEQEVLAAVAQRKAEEARARQQAIDDAEAQRQREAEEAAQHQARVERSRIEAHANLQSLLAQAGLAGEDLWSKYAHDLDGRIVALVAANRAGRGVVVHADGNDTWIGQWRGASARVADGRLEVQVDDPAWRRQHLSERRFVLGERWTSEERQTWADRIGLLSAGAG
ncbi:hypothetical protein [Arenimonas sp. MALMAid1274]|uniref:hypothetical protein n=1 Tax=Arenimonas sp. MALMAid1274 TaxID=3411630 RepID=UPI003BA1F22B